MTELAADLMSEAFLRGLLWGLVLGVPISQVGIPVIVRGWAAMARRAHRPRPRHER